MGVEIDIDTLGGEASMNWNADEQAYCIDPSKEIDVCGAAAIASGIIDKDQLSHFTEWHELGESDDAGDFQRQR